jgi:hypothetical protein
MLKLLLLIVISISIGECYQWIPLSIGQKVPFYAFSGLSSFYVIRAKHGPNSNLPGHYGSGERYAYVSYDGNEIKKINFEVRYLILLVKMLKLIILKILTADSFSEELIWEDASTGRTLVPGGRSASGDQLYICRFSYSGKLIPGKLHNGKCYISYGGREIESGSWETLKVNY